MPRSAEHEGRPPEPLPETVAAHDAAPVGGTMLFRRLRAQVLAVEEQVFMQAWHLRKLLPDEAQPPSRG